MFKRKRTYDYTDRHLKVTFGVKELRSQDY